MTQFSSVLQLSGVLAAVTSLQQPAPEISAQVQRIAATLTDLQADSRSFDFAFNVGAGLPQMYALIRRSLSLGISVSPLVEATRGFVVRHFDLPACGELAQASTKGNHRLQLLTAYNTQIRGALGVNPQIAAIPVDEAKQITFSDGPKRHWYWRSARSHSVQQEFRQLRSSVVLAMKSSSNLEQDAELGNAIASFLAN